jgi:hypothetical protein
MLQSTVKAAHATATFRVETSAKILAFSLKSVQDLTDVWDKIRHLKIDVHLDIFILFRLLAKIAALETMRLCQPLHGSTSPKYKLLHF